MTIILKSPANTVEAIKEFIQKQVKYFEKKGAIVAVSGGLDSALVLKLCVEALGKENVLALMMFERDSNEDNKKDAKDLINQLGVRSKEMNITQQLKNFPVYKYAPHFMMKPSLIKRGLEFWKRKTKKTAAQAVMKGSHSRSVRMADAFYRIKHRIRMVNLYYHADIQDLLTVGAANNTEASIGFFVKYGVDDSTDIMPIINLYKTQVRQLAKFLKLPENIINKAPSPDMAAGLTDEMAIGMTYEQLDCVLYNLTKRKSVAAIKKSCNVSEEKVNYVKELAKKSEHMRTHAVCFELKE